MKKIKYINHVYGKNGLEYDEEKTIRGNIQVVEETEKLFTLKKGRYSYCVVKENIISME